MVLLEYAQHHNGRFAGWIGGGEFPTRAAALRTAAERGLIGEGDEFLISELNRPGENLVLRMEG